jgi:hypothetical protein
MADTTDKTTKPVKKKRLPKGQRTRARRVKQDARKAGTMPG